MLGALGQHSLHLQGASYTLLIEWGLRESAKRLRRALIITPAAGTVENPQVDDSAGGHLALQKQRVECLANRRLGLTAGQGALVDEEVGHLDLAPRAAHNLGIVELQRTRGGEQVEQSTALLQLDDFAERSIDGVGQRLGPEDVSRRLNLRGVDLKRGLASGCCCHGLSIAICPFLDREKGKICYLGSKATEPVEPLYFLK
jgi:hypothetical protein